MGLNEDPYTNVCAMKLSKPLLAHSTMFRLASIRLLFLLTYPLAALEEVAPTQGEDPSSCRSQRTLFNIIWGCVLTTIICAWVSIHPNIPPREGPLKRALRRLELMFWTVVAPEILPCWALNQLLAAITVRDVYNNRKGTLRSSFETPPCTKQAQVIRRRRRRNVGSGRP
jgi:hypothetical protein